MINEVVKRVGKPAVEFYFAGLTDEDREKIRETAKKFGIDVKGFNKEIHFVDTWEEALNISASFIGLRISCYAQAFDEMGNPIYNGMRD